MCRWLLHKGPVFRFCPGGHDLLLREGSMPHGRDALAARFTRAWSATADAPTIAIHLKLWRERSRAYRTTFSSRRAVFLVGTTRHDPQSVIRQWPLQGLGLIPRRAHLHVAFFVGRQDYRHGLGMDRFDDRIGRGGQKAVNKVRSGDRLQFCPAITFELGPKSAESEQAQLSTSYA